MAEYTPPVTQTGPDAPAPAASTTSDTELAAGSPETGVETLAPPATDDAPAEQPALLAGKFKTPADLEAAYKALESKLGQQGADKPLDQILKEGQEAPAQDPAAAPKGLDLQPFTAEFMRDGKLSDASYEALAKSGISKDVVDGYIRGRQADTQLQLAEALKPVGGQEGYAKIVEWAGKTLNGAEIAAYNEAVASANPAIVKMAIEALAAKQKAAEGVAPNLVGGNPAPSNAGYGSLDQLVTDQGDPRYKAGDKAFHAMVDAKLRNTTAF